MLETIAPPGVVDFVLVGASAGGSAEAVGRATGGSAAGRKLRGSFYRTGCGSEGGRRAFG